jgi:hypothetical protein
MVGHPTKRSHMAVKRPATSSLCQKQVAAAVDHVYLAGPTLTKAQSTTPVTLPRAHTTSPGWKPRRLAAPSGVGSWTGRWTG